MKQLHHIPVVPLLLTVVTLLVGLYFLPRRSPPANVIESHGSSPEVDVLRMVGASPWFDGGSYCAPRGDDVWLEQVIAIVTQLHAHVVIMAGLPDEASVQRCKTLLGIGWEVTSLPQQQSGACRHAVAWKDDLVAIRSRMFATPDGASALVVECEMNQGVQVHVVSIAPEATATDGGNARELVQNLQSWVDHSLPHARVILGARWQHAEQGSESKRYDRSGWSGLIARFASLTYEDTMVDMDWMLFVAPLDLPAKGGILTVAVDGQPLEASCTLLDITLR